MPIPKPNLDDRHFQDIVDEAKRLIPRYAPEWTDHNVSDPGIALIELFAWMTDMLLYRVNQIPDKVYLALLEMMGIRLEPPRAARAPVTFYLSAPQPDIVTIPRDTEVATIQTETSPAIIFTTEADLVIRPAILNGVYTRAGAQRAGAVPWVAHDIRQFQLAEGRVTMFPRQPLPGDMFYMALENDHSHHVMALVIDCDEARGAGIDPTDAPIEWQVWQGGAARWANCEREADTTGGFNQPGEIILRLPAMARQTHQGVTAFWLRSRLRELKPGEQGYEVSPDLKGLVVESRGGTAGARHAVTVMNEIIGRSEGVAGQVFRLLNTPLLERDTQRDYLAIDPPPTGKPLRWDEVSDFAGSGVEDQHYILDNLDGSITFGPSLLQPDGRLKSFGAIPPRGSMLSFTRYQFGGGVIGNVPPKALSVVKTSIPYVSSVTNWQLAGGGRDPQSLEDAKLRAPQVLRTRIRAMTAEDYVYLAEQVPGVARACCVAPGAQPPGPNDPKPGQVFVHVLPQTDDVHGRIAAEMITLSADLRLAVLNYIDARRPLGIALDVQQIEQYWVSVSIRLRLRERSDPGLAAQVQLQAETALNEYLNPYIGGPQGDGWPFGRDLHVSEIYGLMQRVPAVEFVESVQIERVEPGGGTRRQVGPRMEVARHGLVCSYQHTVTVA
ncbi:MAG: putative baseplate assembly protein [Roseiflexaceae bacterium]|nr:putative baseplate assembly protein [Roseiflexaceae bacterium]